MRKLVLLAGAALLFLVGILVVNTARFTADPVAPAPLEPFEIDAKAAAERLGGAIRFETIAESDPTKLDREAFRELQQYLEAEFPRVHQTSSISKQLVGELSLLYEWKGQNPKKKPFLLMAHQDVVPVAPETVKDWTHPPFSGLVRDGYVWGRGAIDVKSALLGILEATEALLRDGFVPQRTIYFAFGHDEEVGGRSGAEKIARLLKERNVELEYVLDEGSVIVEGIIPGVQDPVALIGIAEKGYLTLELSVEGKPGHSSVPPVSTTIGILSRAVSRLEENPFPPTLAHSRRFFTRVGPSMPFFRRLIFANLWLTKPIVKSVLERSPPMNAGMRTTTAVTMFNGGVKANVLPSKATAVVNFRIIPGDTIDEVFERVRSVIDDPRVKIKRRAQGRSDFGSEPSPISSTESASYRLLTKTIRQIVQDPNLIVSPSLVLGATDSRHFGELTPNIYRFLYNRFGPDDLKLPHGTNERISVEHYARSVAFFAQLIKGSQSL